MNLSEGPHLQQIGAARELGPYSLQQQPQPQPQPHIESNDNDSGSSTNNHTRHNGNNSPLSPSNFTADLPHEDRLALANKVRAKAWPLVNKQWYPEFHCAAYAGWMSVPGGLCAHNGEYHVFYQHHPFSENWGPMHWGHCVSPDLVHWTHLPIVLAPGEPYDHDGCFSGSAVSHDGRLYIFYTGHSWGYSTNVNSEGICQQQCLAVSDDDGVTFRKLGPVVRPPPEYIHFRDPKVWRQDGRWWMVLGARDVAKDVGQLLLYSSESLDEWDESAYRVVSRADDKNVFMWECPDFFPVSTVTLKESSVALSGGGGGRPLLHSQSSATAAVVLNSFNSNHHNHLPSNHHQNNGNHHGCNVEGVESSSYSGSHNNPTQNNTNNNVNTAGNRHQFPPGSNSLASSSYMSTASSSVCASVASALASNDFVLIYCPQGMAGQGTRYRNRFQSGYLTGHWGVSKVASNHYQQSMETRNTNSLKLGPQVAKPRKEFEITQKFKELDYGHDFYAPQTFTAPDGRRILIGWLDMWESPMPSKEHGWSGVLTIPRELTYDCATQKITMRPIRELEALRVAAASVPPQVLCENGELPLVKDCTAFEVCLTFNLDNSTGEKFGLWLGDGAEVFYDAQTTSLIVSRHYPEYMLSGYRSCELGTRLNSALLQLRVFIDRSSVEVFANDGLVTMSTRIYPKDGNRALRVFTTGGVADVVSGTVWQLANGAVTH